MGDRERKITFSMLKNNSFILRLPDFGSGCYCLPLEENEGIQKARWFVMFSFPLPQIQPQVFKGSDAVEKAVGSWPTMDRWHKTTAWPSLPTFHVQWQITTVVELARFYSL
jgi:hypothetical protein